MSWDSAYYSSVRHGVMGRRYGSRHILRTTALGAKQPSNLHANGNAVASDCHSGASKRDLMERNYV